MKRKIIAAIIAIMIIALLAPCFAASAADGAGGVSQPAAKPGGEDFIKSLSAICKSNKVVGMSVAVFKDGKVIKIYNYGYADRENKIPVSVDTKYRCASISKPVTFIGAMMLAEEGRLDIDAPVSKIIGVNLDVSSPPNTTRHLMTHTSTIGDTGAYLKACESASFASLEKLTGYGSIFTAYTPGTRYEYSNFAAGLVSAVIESVTKQRFYSYMEENIFDKLGIDAAYVRTHIEDSGNISNIYEDGRLAHTPKTWGRTENVYDTVPLGQQYLIGQCELIISAGDLAKIGIILAGDGSVDGVKILDDKSIAEMNKPFISDSVMSYGLGLRMNDHIVEGRTITGHPGQALGMVGGLYFDRSDRTGVAILTNGCDVVMQNNGVYRINNDVIRAVYGEFFPQK